MKLWHRADSGKLRRCSEKSRPPIQLNGRSQFRLQWWGLQGKPNNQTELTFRRAQLNTAASVVIKSIKLLHSLKYDWNRSSLTKLWSNQLVYFAYPAPTSVSGLQSILKNMSYEEFSMVYVCLRETATVKWPRESVHLRNKVMFWLFLSGYVLKHN